VFIFNCKLLKLLKSGNQTSRKINSTVISSATNHTWSHSGLNPKLSCKKLNYCTATINYSYCSLQIMSCALMEDCLQHFVFFLYPTLYSRVFLKKGNNCTQLLLWNTMINQCSHKSAPLHSILFQFNPSHPAFWPLLFSPAHLGLPSDLFPWCFLSNILYVS